MTKNSGFLDIYKGLDRPIYFLMIARIVNAVGSIVMSMISTILAISFGYTDSEVSHLLVILSIITFPSIFIGAKLADKFNRKKMLVGYYFLIAILYISASLVTDDFIKLVLIFTAQIFFTLTYPTTNAMISDFASPDDRARAYSLLYLAINIGYALAPMIGAYLIVRSLDYMLYVNATTLIISSFIIMKFVPSEVTYTDEINESCESNAINEKSKISLFTILKENPAILIFTIAYLMFAFCNAQFNFGLPMQLINQFGDSVGTRNFGYMATLNCIIVIIFTPFVTSFSYRVGKINVFASAGITFALSFVLFAYSKTLWVYGLANFFYTIGEVSMASNGNAIMANLAPKSHRARVMGLSTISSELGRMIGYSIMGMLITSYSYTTGWLVLMIAPIIGGILIFSIRNKSDV